MSKYRLRFARLLLTPQSLLATVLIASLVSQTFRIHPAQAQATAYCQLPVAAKQEKETLLQSALEGNKEAENRYKTLLKEDAEQLRQCRSRTWPETQAIWLRLYPCDIQLGALDTIMDRIVNRGYNQVSLGSNTR